MRRMSPIIGFCAVALAGSAYSLDIVQGADPGLGMPLCGGEPGWYSLFDGTQATIDKYWFLPPNQHQGNGGRWWVAGGVLNSDQTPDRQGGSLFTKHKYKNVEAKLFMKPHWGNDGGLFFRSNAFGRAYQVVIDYHLSGSIGGVWGEGSLHSIAYKPFFFDGSPDKINKTSNWFSTANPADWATKMWKKDDYNWIHGRIYHDDPPWIEAFIGGDGKTLGTQMILYKDNTVEKDNLTGYIGLQIHRGSGGWAIDNPNLYKNMYVRDIQAATGAPLASYPEWTAACSGVDVRKAELPSELNWVSGTEGNLLTGVASSPYTLTVADISGRTVFRAHGDVGSFSHRLNLRGDAVHFATLSGYGFHRTAKLVPVGR